MTMADRFVLLHDWLGGELRLVSPVPPTSTSLVIVVEPMPTPVCDTLGGIEPCCPNECPAERQARNLRLALEGWRQVDVPTRMPDRSD